MELTKFWVAFVASLTAATGYVVFCHRVKLDLVTLFLGVLLLAMGACALNELQDMDIDGRMERTRRRPIPAGVVKPLAALATAALLIAGGFLLIWRAHNLTAALIGLLAIVWYNGVYTYLKRGWAFAVVPGALIGALPPAIGWAAAGGDPLASQVLALCFFFFLWQVPHFWLLLLMFGSDYSKAGLPSLTELFSLQRLASLTFIWMLATAASSLLLPIYRLTSSPWTSLALVVCGVWLVWGATKLLRGRLEPQAPRRVFRRINLYALCVMALLMADALL
jgi:protoheme IX farnesyltransferase